MSDLFGVLADPHRRQILHLLGQREHLVGELVEQLGLSQPAVSKHLKVLREAGLVQVRQEAQRRWYCFCPTPLGELDDWLEPFRQFWLSRLNALERHLTKEREQ